MLTLIKFTPSSNTKQFNPIFVSIFMLLIMIDYKNKFIVLFRIGRRYGRVVLHNKKCVLISIPLASRQMTIVFCKLKMFYFFIFIKTYANTLSYFTYACCCIQQIYKQNCDSTHSYQFY